MLVFVEVEAVSHKFASAQHLQCSYGSWDRHVPWDKHLVNTILSCLLLFSLIKSRQYTFILSHNLNSDGHGCSVGHF